MRRKDWLLGGATALVVVARMVWILAFAPLPAPAQIQSNTARHIIYGISLPATCTPNTGDVFFRTTATIGSYQCLATNTWTAMGAGSVGPTGPTGGTGGTGGSGGTGGTGGSGAAGGTGGTGGTGGSGAAGAAGGTGGNGWNRRIWWNWRHRWHRWDRWHRRDRRNQRYITNHTCC